MVLNSVVLPTPFGPMTPTMPLRGSVNDRSLISTRPLEALVEVLDLDHEAAQARARRDLDLLEVELAGALRLGRHLLVAVQPGLTLGLAAFGVRTAPTPAPRVRRLCSLTSFLPCTEIRSAFFSR